MDSTNEPTEPSPQAPAEAPQVEQGPAEAPAPLTPPAEYRTPDSYFAPPPPGLEPHYYGPTPAYDAHAPRPAESKTGMGKLVAVAAVAAFLASGVTAATMNHTTAVPPAVMPQISADGVSNESKAGLADALDSVFTVAVRTSSSEGTGSGVAIDSSHIVTNSHVVTLGGKIDPLKAKVEVQDALGREYEARVVGTDPVADVAVLEVKNLKAPALAWGQSDHLSVGQGVIAVGAPLGLSNSVTSGIVSALNRPVELTDETSVAATSTTYINAIQTDAAINHGNSGGPLIDKQGKLIGLNVAISSAGDAGGSIGIGYAIPADYVRRVADELIKTGSAAHGLLGIQVGTAGSAGGSFQDGALVRSVDASGPAFGALRKGDVIVGWNGLPVDSANSLIGFVRSGAPGEEATLTVRRGGSDVGVPVKLGSDKA